MAAVPVLFIILPMIQLFAANATGKHFSVHVGLSLLYLLVIPVMVPSVVSAYSVVARARTGHARVCPDHLDPSRGVSPQQCAGRFRSDARDRVRGRWDLSRRCRAVRTSCDRLGDLRRNALAGPVAVHAAAGGLGDLGGDCASARSTDVRAAQQLSVSAGVPPLIVLALMSLNVITVPTARALGLAAALLAIDLLAWRVVAAMFDRERLVTGRRG